MLTDRRNVVVIADEAHRSQYRFKARIELPDEEKPRVDAEIEELTEDEAVSEQEGLKRKWSTVEALVGSEKRLHMVAADQRPDRCRDARSGLFEGGSCLGT